MVISTASLRAVCDWFPEITIEEAVAQMKKHVAPKILVTRADGTLSGVFTLTDLAMAWAIEDVGEVVRRICETNRTRSGKYAFTS